MCVIVARTSATREKTAATHCMTVAAAIGSKISATVVRTHAIAVRTFATDGKMCATGWRIGGIAAKTEGTEERHKKRLPVSVSSQY